VVFGKDREELLGALGALAQGDAASGLVQGVARVPGAGGGVALLFTGQGAQRVGMGRALYEASPVFKDAFDGICAKLDDLLGRSLRDVVFGDGASSDRGLLDQTMFTQPGLFALEVALFRVIEALAIRPDFLIGHSIGELSAAYVAGVFSLEDACQLVSARGRLMAALPRGGAMVSVLASEDEVIESLAGLEEQVSLAAVNGPTAVVLSGDEDAVLKLAAEWQERGRKVKQLRVSHAFHSPRMDGMLEEFAEVAGGLSFSPPRIPIVSNLTGEVVLAHEICSAEYWVRHVREPVRFADGIQWLARQGVNRFVELGPNGVLSAMADGCLATHEETGGDENRFTTVSLLRGERPEVQALFDALGGLWVRGVGVDWGGVFGGLGGVGVGLPSYAFQRERFWLGGGGVVGDVGLAGLGGLGHPLLGACVGLAGGGGWVFTGRVGLDTHPWLGDHGVMGVVLLPGTAFLELVLCAGGEVGCERVVELTIQAPLVLPDDGGVQLQVVVGELDESGGRPVSVYSRLDASGGGVLDGEQAWVCNASGLVCSGEGVGGSGGGVGSREGVGGSGVGVGGLGVPGEEALGFAVGVWPPAGAEVVGLGGV
jgi:acyl transferase domain-containing protein